MYLKKCIEKYETIHEKVDSKILCIFTNLTYISVVL